jgi:hypothetical protein
MLYEMTKYVYRKSLLLQDQKEKLLALFITHMPSTIPKFFQDFNTRVKIHFAKEFTRDQSDRSNYDFLAIHYHWYNRYAEKVRVSFLIN